MVWIGINKIARQSIAFPIKSKKWGSAHPLCTDLDDELMYIKNTVKNICQATKTQNTKFDIRQNISQCPDQSKMSFSLRFASKNKFSMFDSLKS